MIRTFSENVDLIMLHVVRTSNERNMTFESYKNNCYVCMCLHFFMLVAALISDLQIFLFLGKCALFVCCELISSLG